MNNGWKASAHYFSFAATWASIVPAQYVSFGVKVLFSQRVKFQPFGKIKTKYNFFEYGDLKVE